MSISVWMIARGTPLKNATLAVSAKYIIDTNSALKQAYIVCLHSNHYEQEKTAQWVQRTRNSMPHKRYP